MLGDAEIYDANVTSIYAFIYSKIGHRETAQDLTADVFVKALRLVDRTQDALSIRSWLYHVARTTIADYWREVLKARVIPLEEARLRTRERDTTPTPPELVNQVYQLLARLPERYREVLSCRFIDGYSVEQTAATLGLSTGNVKVVQHRALKRARQLMDPAHAGTLSGTSR